MKKLTINADDFGMNRSKTMAILKSFENGWIDTTTLMCNDLESGCFDFAVDSIKKTRYLNRVGIHYCLTEGKPLTKEMRESTYFCDNYGFFKKFSRNKPLSKKNKKILENELSAQTNRFLSSGLTIHHIDSHHHIHTGMGMIGSFKRVMKKYNITAIRVSRNVYSKGNRLKTFLKNCFNFLFIGKLRRFSKYFGSIEDASHICLKESTEIMCHPNLNDNFEVVDNNGTSLEIMLNKVGKKE